MLYFVSPTEKKIQGDSPKPSSKTQDSENYFKEGELLISLAHREVGFGKILTGTKKFSKIITCFL